MEHSITPCKKYPWNGKPKFAWSSGTWDGKVKINDLLINKKIYKLKTAVGKYPRHAVTIVGYGEEENDKYYICQNSYGLRWGYRGYFKVLRELITRTYVPIYTVSPGVRDVPAADVSMSEVDDDALEDVDVGAFHPAKKQKLGDSGD